jgi:hypothetical protein
MTGMSRATFVRAVLAAFGAGALVIAASGGSAIAQGESVTFEFDGGEAASYTVPAGVCSLEVTALGAEGGDFAGDGFTTPGGLGGEITTRLAVAPGDVLEIVVGGAGGDGAVDPGVGGVNGGGAGGEAEPPNGIGAGAGGGGSSTVTRAGETLAVGGGGGGAGAFFDGDEFSGGGAGGGGDGQDGFFVGVRSAGGGEGGSVSAPGAGGLGGGLGLAFGGEGESGDTDGVGTGGDGGADDAIDPDQGVGGGGGGAGYHGAGGGGGSNQVAEGSAGGGGGGASFALGEILAEDPGVQEGDGSVLITPIANTCPVKAVIRFTG